MQIFDGLKMIDIDDILLPAGRPGAICDFLAEKESRGEKIYEDMDSKLILEIDTSLDGNMPLLNSVREYKMVFVPLDLIEEKLIADSVVNSLNLIHDKVLDMRRVEKINKAVENFNAKYDKIASKYKNDSHIKSAVCCMFLYEGGKFKDVYTVVPNNILKNILNNCPTYICNKCKKVERPDCHSLDSFIPEMWYKIVNGAIEYYCSRCAGIFIDRSSLTHVGDKKR